MSPALQAVSGRAGGAAGRGCPAQGQSPPRQRARPLTLSGGLREVSLPPARAPSATWVCSRTLPTRHCTCPRLLPPSLPSPSLSPIAQSSPHSPPTPTPGCQLLPEAHSSSLSPFRPPPASGHSPYRLRPSVTGRALPPPIPLPPHQAQRHSFPRPCLDATLSAHLFTLFPCPSLHAPLCI